MHAESRKKYIIDSVTKIEDETILYQIERAIQQLSKKSEIVSAHSFVGSISHEDSLLMNKAIEEGCEQIDIDDWK